MRKAPRRPDKHEPLDLSPEEQAAYDICQFANGEGNCSCQRNNQRPCSAALQCAEDISHHFIQEA